MLDENFLLKTNSPFSYALEIFLFKTETFKNEKDLKMLKEDLNTILVNRKNILEKWEEIVKEKKEKKEKHYITNHDEYKKLPGNMKFNPLRPISSAAAIKDR